VRVSSTATPCPSRRAGSCRRRRTPSTGAHDVRSAHDCYVDEEPSWNWATSWSGHPYPSGTSTALQVAVAWSRAHSGRGRVQCLSCLLSLPRVSGPHAGSHARQVSTCPLNGNHLYSAMRLPLFMCNDGAHHHSCASFQQPREGDSALLRRRHCHATLATP
jgi:hypothetical protein